MDERNQRNGIWLGQRSFVKNTNTTSGRSRLPHPRKLSFLGDYSTHLASGKMTSQVWCVFMQYKNFPFAPKTRVAAIITLFLVILLSLTQRLAAKCPSGSEPNIKNDSFRNEVDSGHDISDKIIDGSWFSQVTDPTFSKHRNPLRISLKDCRIIGDAIIKGQEHELQFECNNVTFEGKVEIHDTGKGINIQWKEVDVTGNLILMLKRIEDDNKDVIHFERGSISQMLLLTGGLRDADVDFKEVNVGESVLVQYLGPQKSSVALHDIKISGGLVFAYNGLQEEHGWDGSGTPDQSPSLLDVTFGNLRIGGRMSFRGNVFRTLNAAGGSTELAPTIVAGRTYFDGCFMRRAHLTRVDFKQEVQFSACHIQELWLDDAVFEKDVSFNKTNIDAPLPESFAFEPSRRFTTSRPANLVQKSFSHSSQSVVVAPIGGLSAENARFEGKLNMEWETIGKSRANLLPWKVPSTLLVGRYTDKTHSSNNWRFVANGLPSKETWDSFREALVASGDLRSANEADYQSKMLDKHVSRFWRLIWGFGYRPLNPLIWLGSIVVVWSTFYFCHPKGWVSDLSFFLTSGQVQLKTSYMQLSFWKRYVAAFLFSCQVACNWKYGWKNTQGWVSTFLVTSELAGSIFLTILFGKAIANTSPLLKEITDKLLHF